MQRRWKRKQIKFLWLNWDFSFHSGQMSLWKCLGNSVGKHHMFLKNKTAQRWDGCHGLKREKTFLFLLHWNLKQWHQSTHEQISATIFTLGQVFFLRVVYFKALMPCTCSNVHQGHNEASQSHCDRWAHNTVAETHTSHHMHVLCISFEATYPEAYIILVVFIFSTFHPFDFKSYSCVCCRNHSL